MRLLLVRHGQSVWNEAGRWQGQADPPLTPLGRAQALEASSKIGTVESIYSSPLERSANTAQLISDSIGIGPVIELPGLMERFAGEWQGLTKAEIGEQYPGYLEQRRRPPSWEPDSEVQDRVLAAMGAIAITHGATSTEDQSPDDVDVLAVAHAGVIYAIESMLGASHERLANLGGRWLRYGPAGWELGERVELLEESTVPDQI